LVAQMETSLTRSIRRFLEDASQKSAAYPNACPNGFEVRG